MKVAEMFAGSALRPPLRHPRLHSAPPKLPPMRKLAAGATPPEAAKSMVEARRPRHAAEDAQVKAEEAKKKAEEARKRRQ
ncbi:MAG: hypothetical protein ACLU9S_02180 [Oscillospiraceae bacterium]